MCAKKGGIAVITGSGRGIGRSIAVALARDGYDVVVNVRKRPEDGEETLRMVKEHSSGILVQADVSTREGCRKIIDEARKHYDSFEVLVNNAGIGIATPFMTSDDALIQKTLNTNLMSVIYCSQEMGRLIGNGGSIVNMSSIAGIKPMSMLSMYGMTKAAIISLTQYMAIEFAQRGIRVNAIAPSIVRTKMGNSLFELSGISEEEFSKKYILTGKIIEPDEIAEAVIFLVHSRNITGQTLIIDSGSSIKPF